MRYLFLFSFISRLLIYIIIISGCLFIMGRCPVAFALGVIGVYFIPVVCSGLITYYNYKKRLIAPIHGGKNDGK